MQKPKTIVFEDCYDKTWAGLIVDDAFSHPARYARGLIERIFEHMESRGWISKGMLIGDPFGGVGCGGIIAAYRGYRFIGCEIEPKFVALAERNFKLHRSRWIAHGMGDATVILGDSRKFHECLAQCDTVLTSPPYATTNPAKHSDSIDLKKNYETYLKSGGGSSFEKFCASRKKHSQGYGDSEGQIAALGDKGVDAILTSPPYADISAGQGGLNSKPAKKPGQQAGRSATSASQSADQKYGRFEGQISRLPKGEGVDSIVTSPPYANSDQNYDAGRKRVDWEKGARQGMKNDNISKGSYENSEGQIASLKQGDVDGIVTSPPWEKNVEGGVKSSKLKRAPSHGKGHYASPEARARAMERDEEKVYGTAEGLSGNLKGGTPVDGIVTSPPYAGIRQDGGGIQKELKGSPSYTGEQSDKWHTERDPTNIGNLGDEKKVERETYWSAMNEVYASAFQALKSGGYICVVVKDYIKNKQRVLLCDDTCKLLEHVGFTVVERARAMLVKEKSESDLFLGNVSIKKSKKSFFKRLYESRPDSIKIDWEEAIFAQKPAKVKARGMKGPSPNAQSHLVSLWNSKYKVGQTVAVRLDSGEIKHTKTKSPAELLSGHTAVVWLEGISGCYMLTRCDPITA